MNTLKKILVLALMEIAVKSHIIELNSYIDQINIKPNSAHFIRIISINVNMDSIALLHILNLIYSLNLFIIMNSILISSFFIIKLPGALLISHNMIKHSVSMHITGKISEEILKSLNMEIYHVHIGNLLILLSSMMKDVLKA